MNKKIKNNNNKEHMLIKEISSILRCDRIEDVVYIENNDNNSNVYNKIMNIANRIGTIYFTKNNKSFSCSLFSIGGITIIIDDTPKSESIFIRSSDLDLL